MGNMHGGRIAAVVDSRKGSKFLKIYFYSLGFIFRFMLEKILFRNF